MPTMSPTGRPRTRIPGGRGRAVRRGRPPPGATGGARRSTRASSRVAPVGHPARRDHQQQERWPSRQTTSADRRDRDQVAAPSGSGSRRRPAPGARRGRRPRGGSRRRPRHREQASPAYRRAGSASPQPRTRCSEPDQPPRTRAAGTRHVHAQSVPCPAGCGATGPPTRPVRPVRARRCRSVTWAVAPCRIGSWRPDRSRDRSEQRDRRRDRPASRRGGLPRLLRRPAGGPGRGARRGDRRDGGPVRRHRPPTDVAALAERVGARSTCWSTTPAARSAPRRSPRPTPTTGGGCTR